MTAGQSHRPSSRTVAQPEPLRTAAGDVSSVDEDVGFTPGRASDRSAAAPRRGDRRDRNVRDGERRQQRRRPWRTDHLHNARVQRAEVREHTIQYSHRSIVTRQYGLRSTIVLLLSPPMGDETFAVLDQAVEVARRVGLSGLTIGSLADQAQLSKSGLFAHFRSKEALQLSVLEHARAGFEAVVMRPTLRMPRGEPRLRRLFELWLEWDSLPGGCPFIAASTEFDDRPGVVRDEVVRGERDLFDAIVTIFRTGVSEGQFRSDADAEQFAQDLYGVVLGCHHTRRVILDDRAESRARRTFERMVDDVRISPS